MRKSHKDSHFVLLNTLSTGFKQMGHNNTSKNTKYIHKLETEVLIHSTLKNYWYGIKSLISFVETENIKITVFTI